MRTYIFLLFPAMLMGMCPAVLAAEKTVYGSASYIVTSSMNEVGVEELARETAQNRAAESMGSLLVGQTVVEENRVKQDDFKVLLHAMGTLVPGSENKYYMTIDPENNVRKLYYSAAFSFDTDALRERAEALEKGEQQTMAGLEKTSREYQKLKGEEQQYQTEYAAFTESLDDKAQRLVAQNTAGLDSLAKIGIYEQRAAEYYRGGNLIMAETCYRMAAELLEAAKDKDPRAGYNASQDYYKAGMCALVFDADRALVYAGKARALQPDSGELLDLMGLAAWKKQDFQQAVNYLSQSDALEKRPETCLHLANLSLVTGRYDKTVSIAKEEIPRIGTGHVKSAYWQLTQIFADSLTGFLGGNPVREEYVRSGYGVVDGKELAFDEMKAVTKSYGTYLLQFYYFSGNQNTVRAIHVIPFENTAPDDKGGWIGQ